MKSLLKEISHGQMDEKYFQQLEIDEFNALDAQAYFESKKQ